MTCTEPYLIASIRPAELSAPQLHGGACVYCHRTDTLDYAGWIRFPLGPHRTVSAPVAACAPCRTAHPPLPEEPH